jgi:hypothetical protein
MWLSQAKSFFHLTKRALVDETINFVEKYVHVSEIIHNLR